MENRAFWKFEWRVWKFARLQDFAPNTQGLLGALSGPQTPERTPLWKLLPTGLSYIVFLKFSSPHFHEKKRKKFGCTQTQHTLNKPAASCRTVALRTPSQLFKTRELLFCSKPEGTVQCHVSFMQITNVKEHDLQSITTKSPCALQSSLRSIS